MISLIFLKGNRIKGIGNGLQFLLDTATFLWLADGSERLSAPSLEAIVDYRNEIYLSAASSWEIVIKYGLGRLYLKEPPSSFIPSQRRMHRIASLPISEEATMHVGKLPLLHRDPFDRVLIAQAIAEDLTIVTPDRVMREYPVSVLW